jgi:hypothetical protein
MSILLQNAEAAFVQSAQPDGKYHLVVKADLVGHSELQDRLIRKIAQSPSLKREVDVVLGSNNVPQLRVHLSASEKDVQTLIKLEDENRLKQQQGENLGRGYSDIAADALFIASVDDTQGSKPVDPPASGQVKEAGEVEAQSDGTAQQSAMVSESAAQDGESVHEGNISTPARLAQNRPIR